MKSLLRPVVLGFTIAIAAIASAQPFHAHSSHRKGTATLLIPCHRTTWPTSAQDFACNVIHSLAIRAAGPQ